MRIIPVPVNSDNYAYLLVDEATNEAAAVDPAEPQKVLDAARREGCTLATVLTTHHHWDHAGGNEGILKLVPGITVVGGAIDQVAACSAPVQDGDTLSLGRDIEIRAIHTPCHTKGHICFLASSKAGKEPPAVFTGDTLFVGGCGRFFEGSPEEMAASLGGKLARLPPETRVFCGHEYTVKNLEFAQTVEPGNVAVRAKLEWARQQRRGGAPTVPSSIGEELQINPFMRTNHQNIKEATGETEAVRVMARLREMKNNF